ncbi:hypothetical protein KR222_009264, partial [Zaprionus bogoriensis]
ICKDRTDGSLAPHPLDCSAYFVCLTIPMLFYCDQGLQFNAITSECNLPADVQCVPMESESSVAASAPSGWDLKPHPVFVAVDVATGLPVSPMEKYDPQHVECRHFGAYFLPHPRDCQLYFICAYGHLHRHQCGGGTLWDYKSSECQLSENAVCYRSSDTQPLTDLDKAVSTTSGSQVTVCYIVSTLPSDRDSTASTTALSPTREPQNALTCPSQRQSYIPHPEDCSKYYICLVGMPVLTSCPKGLYWDQSSGYCDQRKNVKCFQS